VDVQTALVALGVWVLGLEAVCPWRATISLFWPEILDFPVRHWQIIKVFMPAKLYQHE
jgi:hypothetical protein